MAFPGVHGCLCVAHDRRGHGRSSQPTPRRRPSGWSGPGASSPTRPLTVTSSTTAAREREQGVRVDLEKRLRRWPTDPAQSPRRAAERPGSRPRCPQIRGCDPRTRPRVTWRAAGRLKYGGRVDAIGRTRYETQVMRQEEPRLGGPLGPLQRCARSSRSRRPRRATGWGGWAWRRLATAQHRLGTQPARSYPPPTRPFSRPPEELDLLYKGIPLQPDRWGSWDNLLPSSNNR